MRWARMQRRKDGGGDGPADERTYVKDGNGLRRERLRGPLVIEAVAWCVIAASAAAVFFGNLRFGTSALAVVASDDFFYYAQVARNLALHGASTFDGIHRTNGYHPLWLLVLALATKLFGVGGWLHATTVVPFAAAFETVQFLLTIAIAYFAYRVLRLGCGIVVSCCIQMLLALFALVLVRSGMESGLALAALFGLLWFRLRPGFRWTGRSSFYYGSIAGAMVLARLDSMLLVALLLAFDVWRSASLWGVRVRRGGWFCAGLLPVAAYLLLNGWYFHALLPVSGTAKQLRPLSLPSLSALRSLLPYLGVPTFYTFGPCVLLALLAMALLWTGRRTMPRGSEGVAWAFLLFPFLHILTIVTLSDWHIWQWYLYAWPVAGAVASAIVFAERRTGAEAVVSVGIGACYAASALHLIFFVAILLRYYGPSSNPMYLTALDVRQFAGGHPGIYAMGDRAGAVGYLADVPVVQLEGMMMDRPFLDNIRAQRDLLRVLRQYGVRYYIYTSMQAGPDGDGCYAAKEPVQAGPDSPAMRARICMAPVAVYRHGEYENDVFDLQGGGERQ